MHFGATLRVMRLESGLGLRELASRVGVSSAYLSRVENGLDPAPTPARLEVLARELRVPPTLLMSLAQRVSPLVMDYVETTPEAGTLFLDIAHRELDGVEVVAQVLVKRNDHLGDLFRKCRTGFIIRLVAQVVGIPGIVRHNAHLPGADAEATVILAELNFFL